MRNAYAERNKFYDEEIPQLVTVKGSELRLYKVAGRLSLSKPQWKNKDGRMQMGKTVSIDLTGNKGNQELIELFEYIVDMLKGL